MKKVLICSTAAVLALAFALPADAAKSKSNQKVSANVQASCKAQAAKKFSVIHFMKRRDFANKCIAQHNDATKRAKAKPARQETTGQAPKDSNGPAAQPMSPQPQKAQQPKQ